MTKKEDTDLGLQLLKKDLAYLRAGVDDIKKELICIKNSKVSRERFDLVNENQNARIKKVENLVFGAIGLTLTTIGKMVLDLVIKGQ